MAAQELFQISHIVPDFEAQFDDYKVASNATRRTLRTMLTKPGWNHLEVRTLRGVLSALEKPSRDD